MLSHLIKILLVGILAALLGVAVAAVITFLPQYISGDSAAESPRIYSPETTSDAPPSNWDYMPATPGDWVWSIEGGISQAKFAEGLFALTCNKADGTITLARRASSADKAILTVLTSNEHRSFHSQGAKGSVRVALDAQDSLLDSMAFERGNFGIEAAGLKTIYVPSWPEVSRVIEDCR